MTVWPRVRFVQGYADSKTLTHETREKLFKAIDSDSGEARVMLPDCHRWSALQAPRSNGLGRRCTCNAAQASAGLRFEPWAPEAMCLCVSVCQP